jgi:hypothetical protein
MLRVGGSGGGEAAVAMKARKASGSAFSDVNGSGLLALWKTPQTMQFTLRIIVAGGCSDACLLMG